MALDPSFDLASALVFIAPAAAITATGNGPVAGLDISNITGRVMVEVNVGAAPTGTLAFTIESAPTSGGTFTALAGVGLTTGAAQASTVQRFSFDSDAVQRFVRLAWVATTASQLVSALGHGYAVRIG